MKYDCIVLGMGGVGSGALLAAAKKGWRVLGLDRFGVAHDKGSSHGRTRIIRTAYFEHPNYVPLCRSAWAAWEALQQECKTPLVEKTGLLQVGDPNGQVIQGVLSSARLHGLKVFELERQEIKSRFPAINVTAGQVGIFEESAGFLRVENCVAELINGARQRGAEIRSNEVIAGWSIESDGTVVVHGEYENFRAGKLIIATGAWFQQLLPDLGIELKILRKQQQWFQIDRHDIKFQNGFPCFLFENISGCFYGFPELDYLGMKVAEHSGGQAVDNPTDVDRSENTADTNRCREFLSNSFEFKKCRLVHYSVCMYSMSHDGHFILDHHPRFPQIVFAAGLSGHGFKFVPIIGRHLTDLLDGKTDANFEFLKIGDRELSTASS